MNLGPFLLWIGAIGMMMSPGYDGPPFFRTIGVSELVAASSPAPAVSLASLLTGESFRTGATALRPGPESESESGTPPCPSVQGGVALLRLPQAVWTGHLQVASCQTWTGRRELLPGFSFTQATYGLTLQVQREAEKAPRVRLSPKLHLSFLLRLGRARTRTNNEKKAEVIEECDRSRGRSDSPWPYSPFS
jgi:hypothetical protein